MKTKNIIQRNLPLSQTYTLVETFYRSIEDYGCTCENCGKLISNVAHVKGDKDKNSYYIGMDCASTLTGIKDDYFNFELQAKAAFNAAKSARATLLKTIKQAKEKNIEVIIKAKTFDDTKNFFKEINSGMWETESTDGLKFRNWKQYSAAQWQTHVYPMIKDLLTTF